jgi:hypothetical protein
MTRTKYDWKDKGDFTPEHDQITLWLDENWQEYLMAIIEDANEKNEWMKQYVFQTLIEPEKVFIGNPRLYPDAFTIVELCYGEFPNEYRNFQQVIFEIKPTIDSLGAVVRQMNDYLLRSSEDRFRKQFSIPKNRFEKTIAVLVTNDNRYDAYLLKHGYFVIHPYWTDPSDPRNESESISSPDGQDKTKEAL